MKEKAKEIVNKIRTITGKNMISIEESGRYEQSDINLQLKFIENLLNQGIKIEVINAPVIYLENKDSIVMKSFKIEEGESIEVEEGCKKIFFYGWFRILKPFNIVRLAFCDEDVEVNKSFKV